MKIFEKIFLDSVQYLRYNPRRKFDADRRIIGISAIFQILPTRSCCYSVKGLNCWFTSSLMLRTLNGQRLGVHAYVFFC
jgi:hypothetical protein